MKQLIPDLKEFFDLAITALAAARLAWLISKEDGPGNLAANGRLWVVQNAGSDSWLTAGIHCPACMSFWLSLLLWFVPRPLRLWLATAELARQLVRR